jgi:hypothetical protein
MKTKLIILIFISVLFFVGIVGVQAQGVNECTLGTASTNYVQLPSCAKCATNSTYGEFSTTAKNADGTWKTMNWRGANQVISGVPGQYWYCDDFSDCTQSGGTKNRLCQACRPNYVTSPCSVSCGGGIATTTNQCDSKISTTTCNTQACVSGTCSATHNNCITGTSGAAAEYPDATHPDLYAYKWFCNGNISSPNTIATGNILCTEWKSPCVYASEVTEWGPCVDGISTALGYNYTTNTSISDDDPSCLDVTSFRTCTNGACDPTAITPHTTIPVAPLCSTGTSTTPTGTGPWSWNCLGNNGGTDANCIASVSTTTATTTVNGACDPTAITPHITQPVPPVCSAGIASAVSGTGPWSWNCAGIDGGTTASCIASVSTTTATTTALSVSCVGSPNPAELTSDSVWVNWVATVVGDYAPYTYSWSGTDSLSGTRSSVFKEYTTEGLKAATVTVRSTSNPSASSTVACSGAVSDGDDDGDGDGGGGNGGVNVVLPGPGVCALIGVYSSIPTTISQLCSSGIPTTPTGNGSVANPWSWTCLGSPNSGTCEAYQTATLSPDLDCTVSMRPVASSTVKINTKTTWEVINNNCPSCRKTWSINGGDSVQTGIDNIFENFFTTVGLKTVSVVVSSTTVPLVGSPCSATTTVNQTGSVNEI